MIFDKHANLKYKYGNRHFWCRGYYVDTVGRYEGAIKEYIRNQLEEDIAQDSLNFKEYTDHVDMTFNGIVWYSAYLANKSDVKKYDDYTLLAQSTNTKVYYEKDESDAKIQRDFVYVMDLGGTDEGYIIFIAAYSPWNNYNDFDTGIQYLVNGKQTEMDFDFEFLIDEQEFYDEQDRQEEEENTRDV